MSEEGARPRRRTKTRETSGAGARDAAEQRTLGRRANVGERRVAERAPYARLHWACRERCMRNPKPDERAARSYLTRAEVLR